MKYNFQKFMSRKLILIFIFLLLFSFSSYAQKAESTIVSVDDKIRIVYVSSFYDEKFGISELKNEHKRILTFCNPELNKKEEKVCNALKQFAEEKNIKVLLNADILEESGYRIITHWDTFIDATQKFIEYYNTHFTER